MFYRIRRLLFNRFVLVLLGIAALILAIWYLGPLFAFAEWRPLGSVAARLWLIAILLALLLLRVIIRKWSEWRINGRFFNALSSMRKEGEALKQEDQGAIKELEGGFQEALSIMRSSRLAQQESSLWGRLRRKYAYQLPWYIVIGAPGSGKTTALKHSGLRFPLEEAFGKESVKGAGGTRNCDWWFTDETVLLDTAGRYTTHESDSEADRAEWEGFLGLLRRFRPRQPLNGAILTISVADLLASDETARARHAECLRRRLTELNDNLGIDFPVYVLVTKADLLGGFNEYFDQLKKEQRDQVWGHTLALSQSTSASADALKTQVQSGLDGLSRRLFDGLFDTMLDEHDVARRARAYALPQNFSNLNDVLARLLADVFADSRFASTARLRGVYFTSGTQEGTPFDRVLGVLGRSLGVDASINLHSRPASGKSYFIHDLLREVIFKEAYLAGRNEKAERRERLLSAVGHISVASLLGLAVIVWMMSYSQNRGYIEHVEQRTAAVAEQLENDACVENAGLLHCLPTLNSLSYLADGEEFSVFDPPLDHTFGLYQGTKLQAAAEQAYGDALDRVLVPRLAKHLEDTLRSVSPENLELAYETLKAYLMLHKPQHYDPESLIAYVELDWQRNLPRSVSQQQRQQLFEHLRFLISSRTVLSHYPIDERLVELRRTELARYTVAHRAYNRLKSRLLSESRGEFNVLDAAGPQASITFARASGEPLSRGIPDLFTHDGYHRRFLPQVSGVLGRLEDEDQWVLGEGSASAGERASAFLDGSTQRDVKRLYLHEYVRRWEGFLADVRLAETRSMSESIEAARVLSAPDSPLAQFLRAVARETRLSKARQTSNNNHSALNRVTRRVSSTRNDLERVFGPVENPFSDSENLEHIVDDRFASIGELVGVDGGNGTLDNVIRMFGEMHMSLAGTDEAIRGGSTRRPDSEVLTRVRAEAARLPMPLRGMLEELAGTAASQAAGGIRQALGGELDSTVGAFCRAAIQGRYPIKRDAERDITFADFSRMFSPSGVTEQFFQQHLASRTDMTGRRWMLRQPGGDNIALPSFQQAARIRDVFFPSGGREVKLDFEVRVDVLDDRISRMSLDFDGQQINYSHGPELAQSVSWPGPRGSGQVRMELYGAGLTTPTLVREGPWAPMRLFDQGAIRPGEGSEEFFVDLDVQGYKVVLRVTASSVRNPFMLSALDDFRCPGRL